MWKILLLAAIFACDAADFKCKRGCEAEYRDILRKYKSKYDDIDMKEVKKMAMKYKKKVCFPTCGVFVDNEDEFEVAEPADEFSEDGRTPDEAALNARTKNSEEVEVSEDELAGIYYHWTCGRARGKVRKWCCAKLKIACPNAGEESEEVEDSEDELALPFFHRDPAWKKKKKRSAMYCYTREVWSKEKKKWCCAKRKLGCSKAEETESDFNSSGVKYCYNYSKPKRDRWSRKQARWELKKVRC